MKINNSNKKNKTPMENQTTNSKAMPIEKTAITSMSDTLNTQNKHPLPEPDKKIEKPGNSKVDLNNAINGWLDETKDIYMGMYENQVKNQYDFYNSIMNILSETSKNSWKPGMNFTDLWGYNPKNMELFIPPTGGAMTDYYNQYGKMLTTLMNQVIDFDQKLFDVLSKKVQYSEKDWNRSGEILKNAIENRLNTSRSIMKSNIEMLNKQMNHSVSKNKKQQEEEIYA